MSEFNKYIPRTTADHIVMRGTAFYKCSDIDPKLDEIAKLKEMLVIRDGGGHDVDCKANYNRQCNCGHDSVEEYFKEGASGNWTTLKRKM